MIETIILIVVQKDHNSAIQVHAVGTINCGGCVLIENSVIMLYSFQFFLWGLSVYKHIISTFTERLF